MTHDNLTLPKLIAKSCREYAKNEAIDGYNYTDLKDLIDRYVAGLKTLGLTKGDAVCSFFNQKSVDAPALAIAAMRIGGIHVPLASSFPQKRLSGQCQTIGRAVKLLAYGHDDIDRTQAEAVGKSLNLRARAVTSLQSDKRDGTDVSAWEDHGLILFTSGSSGSPKATPYRHKQLTLSLQANVVALSFSSATRVCNTIPYVWDGGNFDMFGPLTVGGAVCFVRDISPAGIARTIVENRCTYATMPPSLLQTVSIEALSHLDLLLSSGESATLAQFQQWKTALGKLSGTRLLNGYGLTESGIQNLEWECPEQIPANMKAVPLGRPYADNSVYLDEATSELVLVGPQITEGYLGIESPAFVAPPSKFSKNHWAMRTGDSGWQDSEGLYYISGRLDNQLSIFSLRIEPEETETVAMTVSGVDFAHLFIHELGEGETPSLVLAYHVVGAKHDSELLSKEAYAEYEETYEKQFREQMNESVPSHQRPSTYFALGSIPRTISNKKDGRRIAALAVEAHERGLVDFEPFSLEM